MLWFVEPQPLCSEHLFQCSNKVCVEPSRICDLADDCGDGSDETDCGEDEFDEPAAKNSMRLRHYVFLERAVLKKQKMLTCLDW